MACHRHFFAIEGWQGKWATVMVDERPRSGKPCKTKLREDRLIALCGWKNRFPTLAHIRGEFNFGGHISVRTVNRWLNE